MTLLERERDAWIETAAQHCRNEAYYRGLVIKIGETLGKSAYISDDGSEQQDVLCARVPELVQELLVAARENKEAYIGACKLVAEMHAAAMGKICGPKLGVVEDVAEVARRAKLWEKLHDSRSTEGFKLILKYCDEGDEPDGQRLHEIEQICRKNLGLDLLASNGPMHDPPDEAFRSPEDRRFER